MRRREGGDFSRRFPPPHTHTRTLTPRARAGTFTVAETDPRGFTTNFTRDARWGNVVSETDFTGLTATSTTDGMGTVTQTAYPDGTAVTLQRLWPAQAGITTPGFAYATTHTERCGDNTTTFLDGAGRGVRSVHYNTNFTAFGVITSSVMSTVVVDTVYGPGGVPVAVSDPFFAASNPGALPFPATPASALEGAVRWSTFGYDVAWRETSMTHPDNSTQTTAYDGLVITRTDENGHASAVVSDCNSRKLRTIDAINGTVSFAYTPWSTVQAVTCACRGGIGGEGGVCLDHPLPPPARVQPRTAPSSPTRSTRWSASSAWRTPTAATHHSCTTRSRRRSR